MAERVVNFSDLSGEMIVKPEDLVGVVVTDHPDLDQPVRLEAMPNELEQLGKYAIAGVRLEVTTAGDEEPKRYILSVNNFNKLATKRPMEEVLADAKPVAAPTLKRRSHNKTTNGEPLRSFNSLESAGLPHQGKVSAEEARLVRENLEAVNKNRAAQDLPPIDPSNPIDAKRYGLDT
jgi:hypothetical protein